MYNSEIITVMISKYGVEKTIDFCKMESLKNDLLHRSYKSRNLIEAAGEHEYERKWWEEAKVQLENNFIKR
jgi:hypothetical protein